MIPGVPQAQPGKRGRGKRKVESSPQLAELLGLHSPCPAEGLLWIQPIKHQHFNSFSFCLFPHRCFGSAAPVGPARAAVLSGLELPKPCANSSHGGVTGGGICSPSLQEIAAGWQETSPICTSLARGFYSGGGSLCSLEMRWRRLSDVKVFSLLLHPVSHGSCCHC